MDVYAKPILSLHPDTDGTVEAVEASDVFVKQIRALTLS